MTRTLLVCSLILLNHGRFRNFKSYQRNGIKRNKIVGACCDAILGIFKYLVLSSEYVLFKSKWFCQMFLMKNQWNRLYSLLDGKETMWSWSIYVTLFSCNLQTFNKCLLGTYFIPSDLPNGPDYVGWSGKSKQTVLQRCHLWGVNVCHAMPGLGPWRQKVWNSHFNYAESKLSDQANSFNSEPQLPNL